MKAEIALAARERSAGRELEGVVARIAGKLDQRGREMQRILAVALELNMAKRGLVADPDLRTAFRCRPRMPRLAKLSISVAELPGSAITTFRVTARPDRPCRRARRDGSACRSVTPAPMRIAAPPVIKAVLSATTASSLRGLTCAESRFEPGRRVLQRVAEREHLDAGGLKVRDVGQVCPEIAFDHDQAIGRQAGESPPSARASSASLTAMPRPSAAD